MLYDLIAFYFCRTSDLAFALNAHAAKYLNTQQLRESANYLKSLADDREAKPVRPNLPKGGSGTEPPSWKQ